MSFSCAPSVPRPSSAVDAPRLVDNVLAGDGNEARRTSFHRHGYRSAMSRIRRDTSSGAALAAADFSARRSSKPMALSGSSPSSLGGRRLRLQEIFYGCSGNWARRGEGCDRWDHPLIGEVLQAAEQPLLSFAQCPSDGEGGDRPRAVGCIRSKG